MPLNGHDEHHSTRECRQEWRSQTWVHFICPGLLFHYYLVFALLPLCMPLYRLDVITVAACYYRSERCCRRATVRNQGSLYLKRAIARFSALGQRWHSANESNYHDGKEFLSLRIVYIGHSRTDGLVGLLSNRKNLSEKVKYRRGQGKILLRDPYWGVCWGRRRWSCVRGSVRSRRLLVGASQSRDQLAALTVWWQHMILPLCRKESVSFWQTIKKKCMRILNSIVRLGKQQRTIKKTTKKTVEWFEEIVRMNR